MARESQLSNSTELLRPRLSAVQLGVLGTHLNRLHDGGKVPPPIRALGHIQIGRHSFEKCDHVAGQQAFEGALELVAKHGISLPVVTVYMGTRLQMWLALDAWATWSRRFARTNGQIEGSQTSR